MWNFIYYQLLGIVEVILFINVVDGLYEGDACNHTFKGIPGVCKMLEQCPIAIQELKSHIRPQHCGFAKITPIVCCPSEAPEITYTTSTMPTAIKSSTTPSPTTPISTMPTAIKSSTTPSPTTTIATKRRIGELPVGEKSRLACESYKRFTHKMVNSSSLGGQYELIENCPWDHKNIGVNFDGKIAEEGEFPHMVLVGHGSMPVENNCGGILISEKYVLTAAICVVSFNDQVPTIVRLGDLDFADPDDDQHVQEIKIERVIVHPSFEISSLEHNIALLELEHPAQLSLYVKPICLYRWDPAGKVHSGMIAGWGRNDIKTLQNTRLLKGGIQYFTQETCNAAYLPNTVIDPEIYICFGPKNGSKGGACEGDAGGPLQIYNKDVYCNYYAFGILSFGKECGVTNTPDVYTKLYKHLKWIESIVWS